MSATTGSDLRTIRVELDLSLREVAREAGIKTTLLGHLERDFPEAEGEVPLENVLAAMARLIAPRAEKRSKLFDAKMRRHD